MKRILLHLAISVLAFGLGITVSALWRVYSSADLPATDDIPSPMVSIEQVTLGCGPNISYFYGLSNGGHISRTCQTFPSAADANGALDARRHGSSEVLERSYIHNGYDQPAGQTVLILENPTAVRLSTYGETLCETRASSLDDLRWFDGYESHDFH